MAEPQVEQKKLSGKVIKVALECGTEYSIPVEHARQSNTITNLSETYEENSVLPLPNIRKEIFNKVITFMEYHYENPIPEPKNEKESTNPENISEWDRVFLTISQPELFELTLAANFLDTKWLLDCCCKTVANALKTLDKEGMRKYLNIKNDFTPEEEAAIDKENEWCTEF